ncbi:MAG: alanine dehydrogenase [Pseudomonadota bacterium]
MRIGVPKEIKTHEYRVGLTPDSVRECTARGHEVIVEQRAGLGLGATDADYETAGAKIAATAEEVFAEAEMVVKVKEPQPSERALLRDHHTLFTYLHLAPDPQQTEELLASGATCIAYETVTGKGGGLPLLKPMSQVAGRLAVQAGAAALENPKGGRGVLLGGVPGVRPARVLIIGGGVVGFNAAQMAVGQQADVTILDRDASTLERLANHFGSSAKVLYSNAATLEREVETADLVVGAVLIPGAKAPKLITRDMLGAMPNGSVIVDVAIDQGGCIETARPTTHDEPTYVIDGVVHYCVANMPGAVAGTSAYALNNVTLGHVLNIAGHGWQEALMRDPHLAEGLNVHQGRLTNEAVALSLGKTFTPVAEVLNA